MRYLSAAAALICLFSPAFNKSAAQNNAWIELSPSAEIFRVSMPNQPNEKEQARRFGEIDAKGKLYESEFEGASYAIWSLADSKYRSTQDVDGYLDACADLIWEDLLKSARDQLPEDARARAEMTYLKELPRTPLTGREYSFTSCREKTSARFDSAGTQRSAKDKIHPGDERRATGLDVHGASI